MLRISASLPKAATNSATCDLVALLCVVDGRRKRRYGSSHRSSTDGRTSRAPGGCVGGGGAPSLGSKEGTPPAARKRRPHPLHRASEASQSRSARQSGQRPVRRTTLRAVAESRRPIVLQAFSPCRATWTGARRAGSHTVLGWGKRHAFKTSEPPTGPRAGLRADRARASWW
jgi:hypothetical protein